MPSITSQPTVVFIDAATPDYQTLIAGIHADADVYVLSAELDGIQQITDSLTGRNNVSSVHIISHGSAGNLQLGSAVLNGDTLAHYNTFLQSWSAALTDNADILLYGCNIADGEGSAFVDQLAEITGANLAASTNPTGSAAYGGDWTLEYTTGNIEAPTPFSAESLRNYSGILGQFTANSIVVLRVGDGSAALTNAATAVFLDEYDTNGNLLQSIPMPTAVNGSNRRMTLSGTSLSQGSLTLSVNGQFLTVAGYDAAVGTDDVTKTESAATNRVVALIDGNGVIDTSTRISDGFNRDEPRGVATTDGTEFWVAGVSNNNSGGVRYVSYGSSGTSTQLTTPDRASRSLGIYNGQLYLTATGTGFVGLNTVGTGTPTSGSHTLTLRAVAGQLPYEFVLLDRDASIAGVDTLYVADYSGLTTSRGIHKFSFDGTNWISRGRYDAGQIIGLAGKVVGGTVELYGTQVTAANNSLVRIVDTAAFNQNISGSLTTLAVAGANRIFRGVAFSPSAVVNQPPVANSGSLITNEDAAFSGTLSGSDPEGAALTYSIVNQPANGTVTITNAATGAYTFTPNLNFNGSDSFTFRVNDSVNDSGTATITITVNPVNDAPTASGVILNTDEDVAGSGFLLGADVDGDGLTYEIVTLPTKGSVVITNTTTGAFTYTPNANANGADSFTYRVFDGTVYSSPATLTVAIAPVNDAPQASNSNLSTSRNQPQSSTISAADVDGDTLTYSVVTAPANGTLTSFDAATGAFTYLPNAGYVGPDSFSFQANDGSGAPNALSNVATVNIMVNFGNNAPVANSSNLTTNEDVAVPGTLSGTDGDNDPLIYAIATGPSQGSITAFDSSTGAFTYTPNPNANGSDSFSFRVFDGFEESAPATVTITINAINDAPVANAATLTTRTGKTEVSVLTATDVEGDPLSFSIVSAPAHGTVTITNALTGEYTYTANAGFSGSDSFTFRANDGTDDSAPATVNITVGPNSAPIATNGNLTTRTNVDKAGMLTATDPDSDPIRFSIVTAPSHGTVVITNTATGAYTYTPNPGYSGPDSFVFRANDGIFDSAPGTVSVVVAANQAPTLVSPLPRRGATEKQLFTAQIPVNAFVDPDGDSLTYTATLENGAPLPAWLTFNPANRTFSGTPANANVGTIALRVVATDPSGARSEGTFTLTVLNVNDAPVLQKPISDQAATTGRGFSLVLAADTFADVDAGDVLTYTARLSDGSPLPAWLTFDPVTRTFSGTPAGENAGSYRVVVRATDSSGISIADEFDLVVKLGGSSSGGGQNGKPKKLNRIVGSSKSDVLKGTRLGDRMVGGSGNDLMRGLGGADLLLGGDGTDRMIGGSGNDTLIGGRGADVLSGGAGDDVLVAGETTDLQRSFAESAEIDQRAIASNILKGGKGNDLLVSGGRSDVMIGGAGRDTFVLAKHGSADFIRDFKIGTDVIGLAKGLTFGDLRIQQFSKGTRILLDGSNEVIAELSGVRANKLTAASFVPFTRLPL
ncbi:Ig-like domain-containing protein [Leptolyngbya sp. O-77]|uniref:Ig-like domain-containing protein n=1 Tax=Leptolyngbya sp. O-77 TaxID=1080068 RepID=UPI00074D39B3|nr:Ig-like domain-containing protein [Leptolyngbya sp. O-77]BAU44230.1 Hemolysin, chromosomal [Leptolyngbya sp. O-77]